MEEIGTAEHTSNRHSITYGQLYLLTKFREQLEALLELVRDPVSLVVRQ